MKKINWRILIPTSIICLLPILLGIIYYHSVPEQVAIHFNVSNKPDGYMHKNIVLFIFPVILALFQIIACITNDLAKTGKTNPPKVEYIYKSVLPVTSILLYVITLSVALGAELDIRKICCFFLGFLFMLIGNYIPKTNAAYTHGIHPIYLNQDEKLCRKMNRILGYTLVVSGVLLLFSVFLPSGYSLFTVICTCTLICFESIAVTVTSKSHKNDTTR